MNKHTTRIAGVQFDGRQSVIAFCQNGDPVTLRREPKNAHDANAIAVDTTHGDIGYIPRALAANLAPRLDAGEVVQDAKIIAITGGTSRYPSHGVEIAFEMAPNPRPFEDAVGDL